MYRRNLEMEDNFEQQKGDQGCENFIDRVTRLPIVRSAVDTTLNVVKKAKETNGLLDYTLTNAFSAALLAVEKAKPVVNKFEVPIGYFDFLACMTLNKLEQSAPIIKMTPEEIISGSKQIYEETVVKPALAQYNSLKNYSLGRVGVVKDYGVKTATDLANTTYGHLVIDKVDELLLKVDGYLDDYLPKTPELFEGNDQEQEPEPQLDVNVGTIEKATFVSRKLRQRLYRHGLLKLESAKKQTDSILANLDVVFDMAKNLKANFDDKNKALKERFQKLWDDSAKYGTADEQLTVEQRVFYLAQLLTSQLNSTYQKAASTLNQFPKTLQQKVEPTIAVVQVFVNDLYSQFLKAKSLDDVSGLVIAQLQDIVKRLELGWTSIYEAATRSRPIEWAVETNENDRLSNGSAIQNDGQCNALVTSNDKDTKFSQTEAENSSSEQNSHKSDQNNRNCQPNCTLEDCQKEEDEHD